MKWTDSSIELVSCGQWGWTDWDRVVIDGLAPFVRYHSVHLYTGSGDYYRNVFMPHQAERALRICEALIERARYEQKLEHRIGIAFDEWNVWYRARTPELRERGREEHYDLSDALAVASFLNIFIRHCQSVEIANLAQLVNAIAPIFTRPDGLFLQTIYHPLHLYAQHAQEFALDVFVDAPEHDLRPEDERAATPSDRPWTVADLGPFKLLDVSGTCDAAGRELCIGVVNRSREDAIEATLDVGPSSVIGEVTLYEVNGPDPGAVNSFDRPDAVGVTRRSVSTETKPVSVRFAPHSVSVLRCRLE
jgi:alpha-N-arabinofuranosidase